MRAGRLQRGHHADGAQRLARAGRQDEVVRSACVPFKPMEPELPPNGRWRLEDAD
jgi:hypothetical protein